MRLGLALSGGGFRATLFHLGVIRYLRAEGLLKHITAVSGVSGGSITAAHLVMNWSRYQESIQTFDSASDELIRFGSSDIRGRILRRMPFTWFSQLVPRFLPLADRIRTTSTKLLRRYCDKQLFHSHGIAECVDTTVNLPALYVVATNLSKAGFTCFTQGKLIHIPLGSAQDIRYMEAHLTPLALAVAASSALPGFFSPIEVSDADVGSDPNEFRLETFSDGGVGDNLAVNTFLALLDRDLDCVIVSDAGRSFVDPGETSEFGLLRTALRATDLMMFRIRKMELENARARGGQKYRIISISDTVEQSKDPAASPEAVQSQLERLRTDLDPFSSLEAEELIRHGFCLARVEVSDLVGGAGSASLEGWLPKREKPSARDQNKIARRLQGGARRKLRLFALSDWVSWLHVAIGLGVVALAISYLPSTINKTQRMYDYVRAYRLVSAAAPAWESRSLTAVTIVPVLTRPNNAGFRIVSEHRVWDLRRLALDPNSHSTLGVLGRSLLTRTALLVRTDSRENIYRYWYQTSSEYFNAWSVNNSYPVSLLSKEEKTVTGLAILKPWQVNVDVSSVPLNQEFLLAVQSETEGAFKTRDHWWTAMAVTDTVGSASMRILFPRELPYRSAVFLMYPNDLPSEARAFEGIMLKGWNQTELLWEIDDPKQGYTYKVQWDW